MKKWTLNQIYRTRTRLSREINFNIFLKISSFFWRLIVLVYEYTITDQKENAKFLFTSVWLVESLMFLNSGRQTHVIFQLCVLASFYAHIHSNLPTIYASRTIKRTSTWSDNEITEKLNLRLFVDIFQLGWANIPTYTVTHTFVHTTVYVCVHLTEACKWVALTFAHLLTHMIM